MSRSEPTVRVYHDLLHARSFTHSWLPEHSFPLGDATLEQRDQLRSLAGIEVHFDWPLSDERGFVKDFVLADVNPCYLYAAEAASAPRGRVRSHKGLFARNGEIRRGAFVERELQLPQNYSHFVGMAQLSVDNFSECAKWFAEGERSFLLSSSDGQVLSEEFLKTVLLKLGPPLPGNTYINYLNLALSVCPRGDRIYRMGGYSGDGDADFQVFLRKEYLHHTYDLLNAQIQRAAL
jgi:hypothetical protein